MYEICNFLENALFKKIENTFVNFQDNVSWTADDFTSPACKINDPDIHDTPQLVHSFTSYGRATSLHYPLIIPIIEKIKEFSNNSELVRAKTNVLFRNVIGKYNMPHVDELSQDFFSAILYLNDTDGDTYLFNQFFNDDFDRFSVYKKVTPNKNKLIIFNSNRYHASSNPKINEKRLVINLVFKGKLSDLP